MGCFTSTSHKSLIQLSDKLCTYPRSNKIHIKVQNNYGKSSQAQAISFQVTEPTSVCSKEVSLSTETFLISSCILPGLDPRGEYKKRCQDNCFFLNDEKGVLCCLFDGHGHHGERVAEFCQVVIENLFRSQNSLLHVREK
jgi:hypothetical protein